MDFYGPLGYEECLGDLSVGLALLGQLGDS